VTGYVVNQGVFMEYIQKIKSPVGMLTVSSDGKNICGLWIEGQKYFLQTLEKNAAEQNLPVFENIRKWLQTGDLSLLPSMRTNASYNEVKNVIQGSARLPYQTPRERIIPPLPAMVDADSRRIGDIDATLNTALDQAMVEFIIGRRNINNDSVWNAFLADLDRVGSREKASLIEKYL